MIVVHILIFALLFYLSIKLHGNKFLNTVALSISFAVLLYLAPVSFYLYDSKYINPLIENGVLDMNLLFYIEGYLFLFIIFSVKFIKIPKLELNIRKSNIYPILFICLSISKYLFGNFYIDVTAGNSENLYDRITSIFMGFFFFLSLYTLATNRSKFVLPFLLYYAMYGALSGSKGAMFFSLIFIIIYYFQNEKIFSFKNLKYYLLLIVIVPPMLYSVTAYRSEYDFKADGTRVDFHERSSSEIVSRMLDRYSFNEVYYYIFKRADHVAILQMAHNQYDDDDFLLGTSYEIIPNYFLPKFIFPDRVDVHDYYGTQLTEKVLGQKIGNTVIGLSPAVEAFINFSFFGVLVGALHGLIYNIIFQLFRNRDDDNFLIAYFGSSFFILTDTFLSTSLVFMLKDLIVFALFIFIINLFNMVCLRSKATIR